MRVEVGLSPGRFFRRGDEGFQVQAVAGGEGGRQRVAAAETVGETVINQGAAELRAGIAVSFARCLVQDTVLSRIRLGRVVVGMGLLEGMKARVPVAGRNTGQVKVRVVMLALSEMVVHGRTKKRQNHCHRSQHWKNLPCPVFEGRFFWKDAHVSTL